MMDHNDPWQLAEWSGKYAKQDTGSALIRYCIGVYQINQLMEWTARANKVFAQTAAAACIHIMGACELVQERAPNYPKDWRDYSFTGGLNIESTLRTVTKLMQQYVYIERVPEGAMRHARISLDTVIQETVYLVGLLMEPIPKEDRGQGFELEIENNLKRRTWVNEKAKAPERKWRRK
jgi:hypothetical protein